jgi:hypothetical protein
LAETVLQLYIEGATYVKGDGVNTVDSWYKEVSSDNTEPIRLWAIGNVGQVGTIFDVKLAIAYDKNYDEQFGMVGTDGKKHLDFDLAGSTTQFVDPNLADYEKLKQFDDPSAPASLTTPYQYGAEGTVPKLGDGSDLPSHGEYGDGIVWQEFALGDFTLTDSPIADFIDAVPDPTQKRGQINVYEISILTDQQTVHGLRLHFDLYNHVVGKNNAKYVFAPFSHDGTGHGDGEFVPAPSSLVGLCSMAIMGLAVVRRRRRARGT